MKKKGFKTLFLYTGKFKKNSQINFFNNNLKDYGEVKGVIVTGFGKMFYFISYDYYEKGTPLYMTSFHGRPLLYGLLKNCKQIKVNEKTYKIPMCYEFFKEDYGTNRTIIPNYLIHKILKDKDYITV